jgi:hydrogenase expression/formation protein HypC
MCIGIPMQVLAVDGASADCEGRGRRERVDIALVGAVGEGEWILAHQGRAVRTLSEIEARQTEAALDALEAALAGGRDLDVFFADLAGREPELPPHLRKESS